MVHRRTFLKSSAALGTLALTRPVRLAGARENVTGHFDVHPFITEHPDAVFVMTTDVGVKTDNRAKLDTGVRFTRSTMLPVDGPGIPLTHTIPVKPNLTDSMTTDKTFTLEYGMGIVTDPYFVEGVIEGMKELGMSGGQFHVREVNAPHNFEPRGYTDMCRRTGADIRDLNTDTREIDPALLQWVDVPDGYVHRRIPYLWPVNANDTFYLNISKFKSHGTGMTLCCKNHQGSVANKYQRFCHGVHALNTYNYEHIAPDVLNRGLGDWKRQCGEGYPYWNRFAPPDKRDEVPAGFLWCQRTLDNLSATPMGLCIIEGIYGREGCFLYGPNPPLHNSEGKNEARDYMTNVIIFGKDPVRVDIIGHWLAGHEPGNFGFFRLAMDRGLSTVMDPRAIPVYNWNDGAAVRLPLESFRRTPIRADYIPKEPGTWAGTRPQKWYMYDEPFDYTGLGEPAMRLPDRPGARVYPAVLPNPASPSVFIAYDLPADGYLGLDILDGSGKRIATVARGFHSAGHHCAAWDCTGRPPGTYQYRYHTGIIDETKPLILRG